MNPRKTPILLRESPLAGKIQALTRYTRKQVGDKEILRASPDGKHDVTADFDALMLKALLGDDCPDICATLDGVRLGQLLTAAEKAEISAFRTRLVAVIERHNGTVTAHREELADLGGEAA